MYFITQQKETKGSLETSWNFYLCTTSFGPQTRLRPCGTENVLNRCPVKPRVSYKFIKLVWEKRWWRRSRRKNRRRSRRRSRGREVAPAPHQVKRAFSYPWSDGVDLRNGETCKTKLFFSCLFYCLCFTYVEMFRACCSRIAPLET